MTAPAFPPEVLGRPCPYCRARPGVRCRTSSGKRSSGPHEGRTGPIFECPRCGAVTFGDELNTREGYCPECRDWTGPQGRHGAGQDPLW